MELFQRVNTSSTMDKVRNFLSDDFQHLVVKAGYSMLQVQATKMSNIPVSASVNNSSEDGMISHFEAQRRVPLVVDAIRRCPDPYRKILKLAYLDVLDESDIISMPK